MQELPEDGSGAFEVLLLLRFEVKTWTVAEEGRRGGSRQLLGGRHDCGNRQRVEWDRASACQFRPFRQESSTLAEGVARGGFGPPSRALPKDCLSSPKAPMLDQLHHRATQWNRSKSKLYFSFLYEPITKLDLFASSSSF